MITIPKITTVAELQRRYRTLVNKIKESGEPMVVVNNGKPDVVLVDVETYERQARRLEKLEEEYLLKLEEEAWEEHKQGKTVKLKKGQTLMDLLARENGD